MSLLLIAIVVPCIKHIDFTGFFLNRSLLVLQILRSNAHFSVHFDLSFGKLRKRVSKEGGPEREG